MFFVCEFVCVCVILCMLCVRACLYVRVCARAPVTYLCRRSDTGFHDVPNFRYGFAMSDLLRLATCVKVVEVISRGVNICSCSRSSHDLPPIFSLMYVAKPYIKLL